MADFGVCWRHIKHALKSLIRAKNKIEQQSQAAMCWSWHNKVLKDVLEHCFSRSTWVFSQVSVNIKKQWNNTCEYQTWNMDLLPSEFLQMLSSTVWQYHVFFANKKKCSENAKRFLGVCLYDSCSRETFLKR